MEHLRSQVTRSEDYAVIEHTVMCVEKKQFPYMLCTTNMLLHDVNYSQVIHGNSLQKNVRDYDESEKEDYILMNPPYGGHVFGEKYGKAASKGDSAKESFDEDSNMEC